MRRRVTIASITTAVVAILLAALYGIIGNRSDNFFVWLVNAIAQSFKTSSWPWIITMAILLASLGLVFYFLRQQRVLSHALTIANNMLELDDSLLRLLASWIPARDHEGEMKLLLAELLRDAIAEFEGHVHRASILLPDEQGDYLRIWSHYGMPQISVDRIRFYIGSDKNKWAERGVAGEVFLSSQLQIAHMKLENAVWRCDCGSFTRSYEGRRFLPYRSFIAIPIIGVARTSSPSRADTTTCLGVVCFDSMNKTLFDAPGTQTLLRVFARRIAAALLIYWRIP